MFDTDWKWKKLEGGIKHGFPSASPGSTTIINIISNDMEDRIGCNFQE